MMKKIILLLAVIATVAVAARRIEQVSPSMTLPSDSLLMVTLPSGTPSQIKNYKAFTVNFNAKTHNPNYVAWVLTADHVDGPYQRTNKFFADDEMKGCADPWDYRNTGYDRGHMAPAGDMKWDEEAMRQCFSMANMVPQEKSLNAGAWNKLEGKTRQRAAADSLVVVVCGPVPGEPVAHIGLTSVEVPARFFKVILSPYSNPPMAMGFIMPNGAVEGGIQTCAVSVDSVERLTGYDFFTALPDEIEDAVEAQDNFTRWSRVKK